MSVSTPKDALKAFSKKFGSGDQYRPYTAKDEKRLRDRIPEVMQMLLKRDGWCSYRDQLLWLCDPDDWMAAGRAWVPEATAPPEVLARSAFGDLFVLDNTPKKVKGYHYSRTFWTVLACYSDVLTGTDDPNWFFGRTLTSEDMVVADRSIVRAARASAGALSWDEMYTFVPALALGGSVESSKVERVKAREQLVILSQLAPIRRR